MLSPHGCTGDLGTVAEGAHSEVKQDVVLRLETLTVLETKVRNKCRANAMQTFSSASGCSWVSVPQTMYATWRDWRLSCNVTLEVASTVGLLPNPNMCKLPM